MRPGARLARASSPPGRSTRRASRTNGGRVGGAEQIEHVGAHDAVAGGVRDGKVDRAVRRLDAGAIGPRRHGRARQLDHVRTHVETEVRGARGQFVAQQAGREPAGAAAELEDGRGVREVAMRREGVEGAALAEIGRASWARPMRS